VAERLREVPSGMAIVSPHAANESLFYFRRLLDRIGIAGGTFRVERGEEAILSGFPKLQLRADRAPNASGAELHGFERFDGSARSDPGGDAVAVLEDPLAELPEEWGRQASFFLYVGNRLSPAARNAHAILPVTTFAEMEGTFTNFEGRVQRFHQALQPAGLARPAWLVLARLVSLLEDDGDGGAAAPTLASEAFQVMVGATPAMAGLEWASVGLKGARLGSTEAAVPQAQVEGA